MRSFGFQGILHPLNFGLFDRKKGAFRTAPLQYTQMLGEAPKN